MPPEKRTADFIGEMKREKFKYILAIKYNPCVSMEIVKGDLGKKEGVGCVPPAFEKKIWDERTKKVLNERMMRAVNENDAHSVRVLVRNGADVNCRDADGKPPLKIARELKFTDIVSYLEKHGAMQ
ncbi:hypothetical protein AUJ17_04270 [Candidatus Micrarchaeota archaeon CG1_02_47_40]|nr:MAG: hypothetical protein AUJ17_04270 [Candidatus Micrarchaeota archaeon CG1_02_47_40]